LREGVPLVQLTVDRIVGFEQGRVAVEHELNRGLNDRLAARQADGARGIPMLLVCECGRSECAETMEVSPAEYEAVRSCCRLYLVAPDHESPGVTEVIVEVLPRFLMVELLPSAAAAAARQEAGDGARPVTTERRINARDRLTPQKPFAPQLGGH
jgi:hypothetical protein